jgi:hypothetical protein
MKELFYFMYSVYKRYKESDSEAYSSAILVMAYLRAALFFPLVCICISLTDNGLIPVVPILYPIICWIYSKKRAPKKESCISKKKYYHVPCPRLLMFIINFSFGIGGIIVGGLLSKYIREYGLEGWLLRFFH